MVRPHEADLVWDRPTIDAYEASFLDPPVDFWRDMAQILGIRRIKNGNDKSKRCISAQGD